MVKEKPSTEKAHNIHSRTLNYAISIEMQLEDFIRDYFIDIEDKKARFEELILGKEFFTFEQKIKVFEKIIGEHTNLKIMVLSKGECDLKDIKKELVKKIRYIREIRNAVAHNHPFRDRETDEITITYNFRNKVKKLSLNESFDIKFFNEYCEVSDILRGLSKELFRK